MGKISEFESAVMFKMSPELLRWFTSYSPKNDNFKLSYSEEDGVYYYDKDELESFNIYLNSPWPKPTSGTRPSIPQGIKQEIKKEAEHRCPVCRTNAGELAHIEPVSKTLNNHPHNLIYLCPTHHTIYDYGYKYNNVTKEEIFTYKKSLLTFQISQWKLQGNLINSYISAINLIGRIKEIESELLKCIDSQDFEDLFNKIINKVIGFKNQPNYLNQFISKIDTSDNITNKEKAYNLYDDKSEITLTLKQENNLEDCPLCKGKGWTNYYDTCPPCDGEGILSPEQIQNIDFEKYDLENCPLCEGNGWTDHFDTCPCCGGERLLSKEQIQNVDLDKYDLENCPLCEGNGWTDHFDTCPCCGGERLLSKEQIQNVDLDKYDLENCPLCEGNGWTDHFDTCPCCGGERLLSKEQIQNVDLDKYDLENCPLCEGNGWTDHFDTCPCCGGERLLSKEQIQNVDLDKYDLENCPLCEGNGWTDHFDICPCCGGERLLSKEQIQNVDLDKYK